MNERGKYLAGKFIRNGVAGLLVSAFLFYMNLAENKPMLPYEIVIPVVAILFLLSGLALRRKLKEKIALNPNADNELVKNNLFSFQRVDPFFSFFIVIMVFAHFGKWKYGDYIIGAALLLYCLVLLKELKLIHIYLRKNPEAPAI